MSVTIDYHTFKQRVKTLLAEHAFIERITQELTTYGARVFLVGGAIRDMFLGLPTGDLDIEVHGISLDQLTDVLKKYGPVDMVGTSFGVLKLYGTRTDWSIPRRDSTGRKPEVALVPNLSIKEAFSRRDLTINAMGVDLQTFELIDPFHGLEDLRQGILRAPDIEKFQEDPLRFYRVMQFISRFNMKPDDKLERLCATMDISQVSIERVEMEFEKLCLKSARPSLGIRWLKTVQRLDEILPELARTVGVLQNPEFHPEGDVFEHTMQACDAAADYSYEDMQQKLTIILAAVCHDLGKPGTTQIRKERITSYRHEEVGVPLAKTMLKRITTKKTLIATIAVLVRHHMAPAIFVRQQATSKAYKRLARKLAPFASLRLLGLLALADRRGRNGTSTIPLPPVDPDIKEFFSRAERARVLDNPEPPILKGHDLLDVFQAGPLLGRALDYAYQVQMNEEIRDKEELKKRVIKRFLQSG